MVPHGALFFLRCGLSQAEYQRTVHWYPGHWVPFQIPSNLSVMKEASNPGIWAKLLTASGASFPLWGMAKEQRQHPLS